MASTLKITNRQLIKLNTALKGLDGIRKNKDEFTYFNFDTKTAWNIAKDASIVEKEVLIYDRRRRSLTLQANLVPGEVVTEKNQAQAIALDKEIEKLDDLEIELAGILFLSKQELEKNPIPISVRRDLIPILSEDPQN